MIDYNALYTKEYEVGGRKWSVENIAKGMGDIGIDLEKLRRTGAGAAEARMMENFVLHPDEHSLESVAWWAKKGMVKEFHGEDVPMDWEAYEKETGFHYDTEHAYPQNLVKKWTSFVPVSVYKEENKDRKYPLMFVLHGAGNEVYIVDSWGYVERGAEKEWIVIVPSLECQEVIMEILEEAKKLYPVDESRIYVTGFSYGSKNTNLLALQHPEIFAAAAPCGGFFSDGKVSPEPGPVRPGRIVTSLAEPRFYFDGYTSKVFEYGMPTMTVIGNKDNYSWPLNVHPYRKYRLDCLNFWLRANGLEEVPESAFEDLDHATLAEKLLGIALPQGGSYVLTADGIDYAIGEYKNSDGVPLVRMICEDNIMHWPTPELSRQVVDFFDRFARDPETHKTIIR